MWFVYTYRLRLGTVYFKRRRRVFSGDVETTVRVKQQTRQAHAHAQNATTGLPLPVDYDYYIVTTILRFRTMLLFVYNINGGEREGGCRSSSSEPGEERIASRHLSDSSDRCAVLLLPLYNNTDEAIVGQ